MAMLNYRRVCFLEMCFPDNLDKSQRNRAKEKRCTVTIPPGKDRWLATPISLGLSWPRILIHRTWEWRSPSTFQMVYLTCPFFGG